MYTISKPYTVPKVPGIDDNKPIPYQTKDNQRRIKFIPDTLLKINPVISTYNNMPIKLPQEHPKLSIKMTFNVNYLNKLHHGSRTQLDMLNMSTCSLNLSKSPKSTFFLYIYQYMRCSLYVNQSINL